MRGLVWFMLLGLLFAMIVVGALEMLAFELVH